MHCINTTAICKPPKISPWIFLVNNPEKKTHEENRVENIVENYQILIELVDRLKK